MERNGMDNTNLMMEHHCNNTRIPMRHLPCNSDEATFYMTSIILGLSKTFLNNIEFSNHLHQIEQNHSRHSTFFLFLRKPY